MPVSPEMHSQSVFIERFGHLTDDEWLQLMEESAAGGVVNGIEFPGFPPEEVQLAWVGVCGRQGIQHSYSFYRDVKHILSEFGQPIERSFRILDFGCGWGRHLRYFLREVPYSNLYGVDPDAGMIAFCLREVKLGNFKLSRYLPPLEFPADRFDLIYSYSVFSHLSEDAASCWVSELHRILKPRGTLVITTQDRFFLDNLPHRLAQPGPKTEYEKNLSNAFSDMNDVRAKFDRGEHVFRVAHPQAQLRDLYGEALVPPAYIEANWVPMFERAMTLQSKLERAQAVWGFLK